MELIIVLTLILIVLLIGYYVFDIRLKQMKKVGNNKELNKIVSKFPENKEICKKILEMLGNTKTKIKVDESENKKDNENKSDNQDENKKKKASLYIAISDTIYISNIKDEYYRVQTVAHECLHSVQPRRLLLFNFIYSNIYIIYFLISIILTLIGVFKDIKLQIIILSIMSFLYYAVRSYLETDAMIKAKYLAQKYMKNHIKENGICTEEEIEELMQEYDKINLLGIPAYNYILIFNCFLKNICIYNNYIYK